MNQAPPPLLDVIIAGALSGLTVALGLAILWGAFFYWCDAARDYWVRVRQGRPPRW